jgi:hypothetical protein
LELCPHHARQTQKRKQRRYDASAAELLCDVEDFSTPNAVNVLLGNLVRQLARKRIHRRDAMAIAYVGQLLLSSIAALDRRDALGLNDSEIPRIVFDRPDSYPPASPISDTAPASDTARVAALFATHPTSTPQNKEGRA